MALLREIPRQRRRHRERGAHADPAQREQVLDRMPRVGVVIGARERTEEPAVERERRRDQ